jgi:signal transduction histidine kinase
LRVAVNNLTVDESCVIITTRQWRFVVLHDSEHKDLSSPKVLVFSDSSVDITSETSPVYLKYCDFGTITSELYSEIPLVIIFAITDNSQTDNLTELLSSIDSIVSHAVPLLLYKDVDTTSLMKLIRCGLFDAISLNDDTKQQQFIINRAISIAEAKVAALLLKKQHNSTSQLMLKHRESLKERIEKADNGLVSSHNKLERTLTEVTDQMAQLSLLYKFGRELSSASNWDKTLESMLENLAGFVEANGAALVLRPSPGSPFSPRKTFQWDSPNLKKMLDRLESERDKIGEQKNISHGIFLIETDDPNALPVSALPLDHKSFCLGYLLLLGFGNSDKESKYLPLLNAIQIILAEEVASAQMLDRIRELSTFNSQVLETVNSGIWVLDETGKTIYCNRQGRELISGEVVSAEDYSMPTFGIGRGRGDDSSNSAASFLRESAFKRTDLSELFENNLLSIDSSDVDFETMLLSKTPYSTEGTICQPNGQLVPVLVQSSQMQVQGSDNKWLVIVLDDLRTTKRLEAEKVRADNLESLVEMSATLAHEIRNPLMGLSAQAELLSENLEPNDGRSRYLDVITSEVTRINDTITRMLNYTRPYEPDLSEIDIIKLAEDCIVLAEHRCKDKSVRITNTYKPAKIICNIDGNQIKQVILNVLFNAIDASPDNCTVELKINEIAELEQIDISTGISKLVPGVEVSVIDSGAGFSKTDSEKLFRPFFTTKTSGTGLGLSMCKKIIEAHLGNITADCSDDYTVFRFSVPSLGQN